MTIDYDQFSDVELRTQVVKVLWHGRLKPVHPDSSGVAGMLGVPISKLTDSHLLSLVKRAIEKQYECWDCMWIGDIGDTNKPYCFGIHTGYETDERPGSDIVDAWGETEERAGCIAFLKAVALVQEIKETTKEEIK